MLRIHSIFFRDKIKDELLSEAMVATFSSAAESVKSVADVDRKVRSESKERLLKLRNSELYENSRLVNAYYDPIRNGDLFEITIDKSTATYVLIAQPCDIMVRIDGKRARENLFKVAVLAPVDVERVFFSDAEKAAIAPAGEEPAPQAETVFETPPAEKPGSAACKLGDFELTAFGLEGKEKGWVFFSRATVANLPVLDLAVFNTDGKCEIEPSTFAGAAPIIATRAWRARATELVKIFNKVTSDANGRVGQLKAAHQAAMSSQFVEANMPRASSSDSLKKLGKFEAGKFSYPIKRIGRVRDPLAASLLSSFSRYLSRDAFEHDFVEAQTQ